MAGEVFVVVLPLPGDHRDLRRAQLPRGGLGGAAGAAGAQDHRFFPRHVNPSPAGQVDEAVDVGVAAGEGSVPVDHRVHRSDGGGPGVHLVAQGDHRPLVGDGHVQPLELPAAEEVLHLAGRRGQEAVVIARQGLVELGGEAVAQFLP